MVTECANGTVYAIGRRPHPHERHRRNLLDALYRSACYPGSIAELNGDTRGASSAFPLEGKSFQGEQEDGHGINRVNFFGKRRWYPFKTRLAASFLDGKPTFQLDYSGPTNPPFIRSIVDEIREVAPGLYFGPAALNFRGRPRPVLFFAVSHR